MTTYTLRHQNDGGLLIVNNSLSRGIAATGGGGGGTSNFTVTTEPSDPYAGECVRFKVEGDGSHAVLNDFKDINVYIDVGESGATFESVTGFDAEKIYGRYGGHCYETGGSKTATVYSNTFGSSPLTQTHSFSVTDPDSYAWDMTYWVDFNGSSAGMDPEDSTNTHILSISDWSSERNSTSSTDRIRVLFRGGVTHSYTSTSDWSQAAKVVYVSTFGSGKAKIKDNTGSFGNFSIFAPRTSGSAQRFILHNLDIESSYDPITGSFNGDSRVELFDTNNIDDAECTVWRCKARGLKSLAVGSGINADDKGYKMAWVDNDVADWFNYGLGFSGACDFIVVRGNKCIQNIFAGHGDDKTGNDPEYPDHGPFRASRFERLGICQNDVGSSNGWTESGFSDNEYAIQHCFRVYMDKNPENSKGCIIKNRSTGRSFLEYGHASPSSDDIINNGAELLIVGNSHDFCRQGAIFMQAHTGGAYIFSNVAYRPNLDSHRSSEPFYFFHINSFFTGSTTTLAAWQKESYSGFNTIFSDATSSNTHGAGTINEVVESTYSGSSPVYTNENNLVSGDGHSGSYVTSAGFSRGDDFQAVTGTAADDSVTTGVPVDYDMAIRSNPTNKGAHHSTVASATAVSSPSHSGSDPTIANNSVVTGDVVMNDAGDGWSNWDNEGLFFLTWRSNGVNDPNTTQAHVPVYDSGGSNISCVLTVTNRSGNQATATSNTI